jgi:hypothetical protein
MSTSSSGASRTTKDDDVVIAEGGACEDDSSEVSERLDVRSRIIGDLQFATRLEASVYKTSSTNSKSDKKSKVTSTGAAPSLPVSRFVVGPNGATVLRISTHKLLKLMKNDSELSASIQRLVLIAMQEKLSRMLLQDGGLVIQSGGSSSTGTPNATDVIPASI